MAKEIMIKVPQDDFGALCVCALRYCQGRETYMPSLIQGIVRDHLSEMSDRDIGVMLEDCKMQKRMNLYGSETIDKPSWLAFEETVKNEKRIRDGRIGKEGRCY